MRTNPSADLPAEQLELICEAGRKFQDLARSPESLDRFYV